MNSSKSAKLYHIKLLIERLAVSRFWALSILLLVIAGIIGKLLLDIPTRNLQLALFPLIFVCLYGLPKRKEDRPPALLFISAALIWVGVTFGYPLVASDSDEGTIGLALLSDDDEELASHQFRNEYRVVAKTYLAPSLSFLRTGFSNDRQALNWLGKNPQRTALIYGNRRWARLVLESPLPDRMRRFELAGLPKHLLIDSQLAGGDFSVEQAGISSHGIAWITKAYGMIRTAEGEKSLETQALANGLVNEILKIAPSFSSPGLYLLAVHLKSLIVLSGTPDTGELECLIDLVSRAYRRAHVVHNAKQRASLLNNGALALIGARNDIARAKLWLRDGADIRDKHGRPPSGAIAAHINLMALEKIGLGSEEGAS